MIRFLLDAIDAINQDRKSVTVNSLVLVPNLVRSHNREDEEAAINRLAVLEAAWPDKAGAMSNDDLSILRELFGGNFLTEAYPIKSAVFVKEL